MSDLILDRTPQLLRRVTVGLVVLLVLQIVPGARAANPAPGPGTITTYAGGILGSILNDLFSAPQGLAVWKSTATSQTFVYVSDSQNHRVKKVILDKDGKPTGVINFAGGGLAGFSGDGEQAYKALLNYPTGLSVDGQGNLYIADTGNNRIRKVERAGNTITTTAGTGAPGFGGDGAHPRLARLHAPFGVSATSSGSLYIADTYNHRIRYVSGESIRTVAGNGVGDFSTKTVTATATSLFYPRGVSAGPTGTVYIADTYNHQIRMVTHDDGVVDGIGEEIITTIAGNGENGFSGEGVDAGTSQMSYPAQILITNEPFRIFVSDTGNNRVRLIDASNIIKTIAGNGKEPDSLTRTTCALEAQQVDSEEFPVLAPTGLALFEIETKKILVAAASENSCLRRITSATDDFGDAILDTVAGTGLLPGCCSDDGFPVSLARLFRPGSAAVSGTMTYVADTGNNRVIAIDDRKKIITVAGRGCRTNDPEFPENDGPNKVERPDEEVKIYPGPPPPPSVPVPTSTSTAIPSQSVPVKDPRYSNSTQTTIPGRTITSPSTIPLPAPYWSQTRTYFTSPTPADFAVDALDPRMADLGECPLGDGVTATMASLNQPWGVALDSMTGDLYIADTYNHRIRKVSPEPGGIIDGVGEEIITTVAGTGNPTSYISYGDGSSATNTGQADPFGGGRVSLDLGDKCPEGLKPEELQGQEKFCSEKGFAAKATLNFPYGVAESNGRLYIADAGNHRVRTVSGTLIDTVAGRGPCAHRHGCPSGNGWFATSQWLDGPRGVAVGPDGSVYIADTENNAIRKVTPGADGVVDGDPTEERMHTVIGGVLGHCDPSDCFFDPNYPDTLIAPVGPTLAGGGRVSRPQGVTVNDEGIVYFADTDNHRERRVDPKNLKFLTIAGTGFEGFSGDGGPAPEATMRYPRSIIFRGVDALLMDTDNNRVRIVHKVEDGWGYIVECKNEIPQSDARRLNEPWPAGQKVQAIACRPTDI